MENNMSKAFRAIHDTNKRTIFMYSSSMSEDDLKIALGVDETMKYPYESGKPPVGIIFVDNENNIGWIADKHAFYGWNIMFGDCNYDEHFNKVYKNTKETEE